MRGFKSPVQARRFLPARAVVGNLIRLGRHLLRAAHYREFRLQAFSTWQQVTSA
jgi:putative transposase